MPREIAESEKKSPVAGETSVSTPDMGSLIRAFDWGTTPLGPAAEWPESLKAVVRILLTSRFAMWMGWGSELTFLYNDAYGRMTLGKKHPWALGRPASEVWSEIWKEIGPRVERVLQTREASWDEELLLILERNGYSEETYHTFSYSPLTGPNDEITGLLCVVIEETARVIGERQVMLLRTLAASLGDSLTRQAVLLSIKNGLEANERDLPFTLIYLLDESGKRVHLACCTGVEAGQLAAPQVIEIDRERAAWPVKEVLAKKSSVAIEGLSKRFGDLPVGVWGTPPTKACLVPIAGQGQERPAGILIAGLNPYRQLDASYGGFLDLVAGQIAAGFASSRAFEQERDRAQALAELDQAKTTFFSNVSHELRTPLTLMLGPLEDALQNGAPPPPASLGMLHRNAMRLLKLVNTLLDFSRIEAGRLHATYQATDLSLLTTELSSVFREAVERAGLKLTVECLALPEPVYVDHEMWEKVIFNLLSNALKSTFDGEIRVKLHATATGAELRVTDTGTGISAEDLPRIFDRFSRIENVRRRSHEGTGIGLALVRELVQMHGGTIGAESAPGEGTTFTVTLPFGRSHLEYGQIRNSPENPVIAAEAAVGFLHEALSWMPGQHSPNGTHAHAGTAQSAAGAAAVRPRILLADDNADMRNYVGGLLSRHFQVVTAENGKAALEDAIRDCPDLVLTDVMMPVMDGFALLSALREHPATRMVPVIMLSARAGEEARIEGLKASADDYLIKPFTARELIARVEAHLKMARLRREAFEQEATLTREVRKAQQLALEVLEHTPEAFFLFDKDFQITFMNSAAEEIIKRSGEPHLGRRLWDLYPEVAGSALESHYRRAVEQQIPVEFEYYFEPWERWYRHRAFPQPSEGLAVYVRDSTDSRKAEQVLRRSEQLAAAGRLAVSISHEINNPLEAVTNVLYLAKMDEGLTGKARDLLAIADVELQRLSHIAARSLKFYRQRTSPTPTLLEEVLDSVLFFHETGIKTSAIRLERRYKPAPPVLCMPGEVQQVFTNLIGNALDALASGGRLIVAARASPRPGGARGVRVTIADSGIGMDKETLNLLFRPFFTTKGEAGTGLGLWVSKGILENHGADFAVRSKRGCGTVFRLFFPLNAAPKPTEEVETPREKDSKAARKAVDRS